MKKLMVSVLQQAHLRQIKAKLILEFIERMLDSCFILLLQAAYHLGLNIG